MLIEEHLKGTIHIPINKGNDEFEVIIHEFTEDDVIHGSCSITSRCCDDQTFSIGGVRPAELAIKLRLEIPGVNAYTLYGAKIRLYSSYHAAPVPDDKWLLRGEFWVTSVKRTKTIYTLRTSDAIIWLDSGSYIKGETNEKDPIYKMCSSAARTLDANFNEGIAKYVNQRLRDCEVDEINFHIRKDVTNNSPFLHNSNEIYGYAIIPEDISGGHGVKTARDYAGWIAELTAGCVQMIVFPDTPEQCDLFLTPFGYKPTDNCTESFRSVWEDPVKIPYETIELDSCDIADYELYIQKECVTTHDDVWWANGGGFAKYKGNITLDLTDNLFLVGRYYHNTEWAKPWGILVNIGNQLGTVTKRPFSLKCHPVFESLEKMPKLGQRIEIEENPGKWKESLITKMVWKFRGGWEFGCAGSDSRVLSQAAKRSLASHAEEKCKAYANIVANNAGNGIEEAKRAASDAFDQANAAMDNGNIRVTWDQYNIDIPDIYARLSALESR